MAADFVEILSPKALEDLRTANAEVLTLISNMDKVGQSMNKVRTPSGANAAGKDLAAQYLAQEKALERVQKANERARLSEIKLQQDREKAFDRYNANLTKEEAKLNASQSVYNKVQQKVNLLTKTYNDLAIKKELGIQLSVKEEAQLLSLNERLNKYQSALKNVDASIQKNQRNVGNYAGSFNGLGNSINQITRELPAFTFSAQTGFLALSNNIPILTDEIGKLAAKNKELVAQGQPVKSVFSQILAGVFSLQTAMGVGILLFTLYGKQISEFASNFFSASKGIDAVKESQKQLNDINVKGQKDAVQETVNVKSLLEISKDQTLTMQQRMIAVKELQETYPAYFGNLTKEKILAGETAAAEKELTDAILSRAKANAAVEKITENQGKIIDLEVRKLELAKEQIQAEKDLQRERVASQASSGGQLTTGVNQNQFNASIRLASIKRELTEIDKKQNDLTAVNNTLTSFAIEKEKESILLKYKETKASQEKNREDLKAIELDNKNTNSKQALISKLEEQISLYKTYRDEAATNIDQYRQFDKVVRDLSQALDLIKDPSKYMNKDVSGLKAQQDAVEKHKEGIEALNKAMKAYSDGFYNDFVNNSGFTTTFKILNDEILGFGSNAKVTALAVSESFQEMYNFINQMSAQNFDAEKQRLEEETKVALAFAGDSQTAQDEINRQAEEKRKQIQRREFQAKKQQAIFNIAIDTAQAIAATIGRTGFFGIPLTAIVAALGAAQIAAVMAQEVPAYKMGTDNHKGGTMLVNDGSGSNYKETIQTPDGKIYQPKERNVIMNAPKGTKVFTHDQWQRNLDNILTSNSINYAQPNVVVNSGMSDEQVDRIVSTIANKQESHLSLDKSGIKHYVSNGHTTKEILNSQVTFNRG